MTGRAGFRLPRALAVGAVAYAATWLVNRSLVAVRGPSMSPTLGPGTRLVTVPPRVLPPTQGRVVVVDDPVRPGRLVVKRVADLDDSAVVVLGDNPGASTDSRVWGPLPRTAIRRVAVARWPGLRAHGLARTTHTRGAR